MKNLIPTLTQVFALATVACGLAASAEWIPSTNVVAASGTVWTRHTIDNGSHGADGVKLGDLNRDGRVDIVTGWEEGGEVRAYLNPGPDKLRQPWPRVTVGKATKVEEAIFMDTDGDGRLEILSGTEGKERTVYLHRFEGSDSELRHASHWRTTPFPATRGKQMWMQAVPLEVDGENGVDLILGSKGEGATIGWLRSPPRPRDLAAWTFHPLREAGWIMSLETHDMDGDGDMDVLFTDRQGKRRGAFWMENPGASANRSHASWPEHPIGALDTEVLFADVGDLNGDGRPDLAAAVKPCRVAICLRQADGGWNEHWLALDATNLGNAKAVKIADLNRDGLADLIFTCEGATGPLEGVVWLEQQRAGPWLQRTLGGPDGLKFDLIQTVDIDGDGDLDVFTCEERDQLGVFWYENRLQHGSK